MFFASGVLLPGSNRAQEIECEIEKHLLGVRKVWI